MAWVVPGVAGLAVLALLHLQLVGSQAWPAGREMYWMAVLVDGVGCACMHHCAVMQGCGIKAAQAL